MSYMHPLRTALAAGIMLAAVSCGSSSRAASPGCEQLVDHFVELAGTGDRAAFVEQCEAMGLSERQARCVMDAEHLTQLDSCDLPSPTSATE